MFEFLLNDVHAYWTKNVFVPDIPRNGSRPQYSVTVTIPKDSPQLQDFCRLVAEAVKEHFGTHVGITLPLIDADKYKDTSAHPELKGCYTLRASTFYPFSVLDKHGAPITQNHGVINPGCDINLYGELYPYGKNNDTGGKRGIGARALSMQYMGPGTPVVRQPAMRNLPFKFVPKNGLDDSSDLDSEAQDLPKSPLGDFDEDEIPF